MAAYNWLNHQNRVKAGGLPASMRSLSYVPVIALNIGTVRPEQKVLVLELSRYFMCFVFSPGDLYETSTLVFSGK